MFFLSFLNRYRSLLTFSTGNRYLPQQVQVLPYLLQQVQVLPYLLQQVQVFPYLPQQVTGSSLPPSTGNRFFLTSLNR
jgi:hypothetical protein